MLERRPCLTGGSDRRAIRWLAVSARALRSPADKASASASASERPVSVTEKLERIVVVLWQAALDADMVMTNKNVFNDAL